jgi:transcriptional regulator with XRE-family HTH domain
MDYPICAMPWMARTHNKVIDLIQKTKKSKAMSGERISTDRKLLGEAIRLRRKSLKMTQGEVAKIIFKSIPTISKIEAGLHPLDIDTLIDVAKGLQTTPTRLIWNAQRKRLLKERTLEKIVPVFDSLLSTLENSGVDL